METVESRIRHIVGAILGITLFVGLLIGVAYFGRVVGDMLGTMYGPSGNMLDDPVSTQPASSGADSP